MHLQLRPLIVVAALAMLVTACGWKRTGTSPNAQLGEGNSVAELVINDITQAQALKFVQDLEDYGDMEKVQLKSWTNGTAVYVVEIDGAEAELPAMIAEIPEPGFKYLGRTSRVTYRAFDNKPPTISVVKPDQGTVTREKQVEVVIEIPEDDVGQVTIGGRNADRSGSRFSTVVPLKSGANDIAISAKDKSGNEATAQVRIGLDDTPPEVKAAITVLIEGDVEPGTRVIVGGEEISVDSDGHWKAPVKVKQGQKEVEVIAIDPHGNRTEKMQPIGS